MFELLFFLVVSRVSVILHGPVLVVAIVIVAVVVVAVVVFLPSDSEKICSAIRKNLARHDVCLGKVSHQRRAEALGARVRHGNQVEGGKA